MEQNHNLIMDWPEFNLNSGNLLDILSIVDLLVLSPIFETEALLKPTSCSNRWTELFIFNKGQ